MDYNYRIKRPQKRMRLRVGRIIGLLIALVIVCATPFFIVHTWQKSKEAVAVGLVNDENIAEAEAKSEDISSEQEKSLPDNDIGVQSSNDASAEETDETSADNAVDVDNAYYEKAMPILVNLENFIPEGYEPDLVNIDDRFSLNRKAAAAWQDMRAAAAKENISLWAVSAYRSNEKQIQNFNNTYEQHIAAGKSNEDAHALTAAYIAIPGTSEHTLGLAVDIISLEESFENTREFAWLSENCAKFGFILRYPKDKVNITKINYEPWHYRYVGSNHAEIVMKDGLSLEEYLGDNLSDSD